MNVRRIAILQGRFWTWDADKWVGEGSAGVRDAEMQTQRYDVSISLVSFWQTKHSLFCLFICLLNLFAAHLILRLLWVGYNSKMGENNNNIAIAKQ